MQKEFSPAINDLAASLQISRYYVPYPCIGMSSLRRILSSRANGAKSRGPKTAEGKRVSAMNPLRHGLAAKTVVLGSESQAGFDELHQACIEQFQPRTKFESYLVLEMAAAKWRQSRIWSIETAALELEMDRQQPQIKRTSSIRTTPPALPWLSSARRRNPARSPCACAMKAECLPHSSGR